jgi:hypothetical protein
MSDDYALSHLRDHVEELEQRVAELTAFIGYLAADLDIPEKHLDFIKQAAFRIKTPSITGIQEIGEATSNPV